MIVRVASWVVVLGIAYGVWHYVHEWRSPLAIPSPVLSQLPPAAAGCGEKCQ